MKDVEYELVCGIEIHIELSTRSKMFCGCKNDPFGAPAPNVFTCPTCLGMPGTLPLPNKEAIESILRLGLAIGCEINRFSKFDRKHYFYPDLPKSYQLSQYDIPFCLGSALHTSYGQVKIRRIHLEEDTAKLLHRDGADGPESLIDFNRSGVPLMELVTEPDIRAAAQAKEFAKKLRTIVRYLGIGNCDLEQGGMRLEANVSLREIGTTELPAYKVEVKNINSFNFLERAINYEIARQSELLGTGVMPRQETRGWHDVDGVTVAQRTKENAEDYRYFPDPDIPLIELSDSFVNDIRGRIPELPDEKVSRWEGQFGIERRYASALSEDRVSAEALETLFVALRAEDIEPNRFAKDLTNKRNGLSLELPLADIVSIYRALDRSDSLSANEIQNILFIVIQSNSAVATDYRDGKEKALNYLLGESMRQLKGKAQPGAVRSMLVEMLRNA